MVVAGLGLVVLGTAPPASAGDLGFASLDVYTPDGDTFAYGDPVRFVGSVIDQSTSCGFGDCDTPVGNVVIELPIGSGTGFNLPVEFGGITPFASFDHVVPGPTTSPATAGFFLPGSYTYDADFDGNFTTGLLGDSGSFTVVPRPCAMSLTQSLQQSEAGGTFELTADVSTGAVQAPGQVQFFQGPVANDVLLGTVNPVPANNLATITVDSDLLQLGGNEINAVYTPSNGTHLGCTRQIFHFFVNGDVPPTANPDTASVLANVPSGTNSVTFDLFANDTDPDGPAITAFDFVPFGVGPQDGDLVQTADPGDSPGMVTYTPDVGFVGDETFQYAVTTNGQQSFPATVNIVVECTPIAADDAFELAQDEVLVVGDADDVLDNDPKRCEEAVQLESGPEHGSLSGSFDGSAGEFTYTPDPGFVGVDQFTYVYTSGQVIDSRATVLLQVVAPAQVTTTTLATTSSTTGGGGSTSTSSIGGGVTSTTARVGSGTLARTGDGPSGALVVAGALLVVGGLCYGAPVTTGRRRSA